MPQSIVVLVVGYLLVGASDLSAVGVALPPEGLSALQKGPGVGVEEKLVQQNGSQEAQCSHCEDSPALVLSDKPPVD